MKLVFESDLLPVVKWKNARTLPTPIIIIQEH